MIWVMETKFGTGRISGGKIFHFVRNLVSCTHSRPRKDYQFPPMTSRPQLQIWPGIFGFEEAYVTVNSLEVSAIISFLKDIFTDPSVPDSYIWYHLPNGSYSSSSYRNLMF